VADAAAGAGGWDNPQTARAYTSFCAQFPIYRLASEELARAARVDAAALVIDLACGTGATSEVILGRLPPAGRILAVDASAAMLAVARERLTDRTIRWVHARAEDLADHVAEPADAVLCNSAIWQTDMPAAFAAVRRVLRPGGRFAFNIGADHMTMPEHAPSRPDSELSLLELMRQVAAASYGWQPAADPGPRAEITVDSVTALLAAAGFAEPRVATAEYSWDHDATRAWLSIPIFTEGRFPGLGYDQRMHALDAAYRQLDQTTAGSSRWVVFTATAPG
jgi:ubiquinone/menaquinone biosynthesis C-methylase UbiE